MKVVIQRVDSSSVKVNMDEISSIDNGLLILWGVEVGDSIEDVKTANLEPLSKSYCEPQRRMPHRHEMKLTKLDKSYVLKMRKFTECYNTLFFFLLVVM